MALTANAVRPRLTLSGKIFLVEEVVPPIDLEATSKLCKRLHHCKLFHLL